MKFLFNQDLNRVLHYSNLLLDDIRYRVSPSKVGYTGRVVMNSFPKSGTHLMESILRELPGLHCPMHRTIRSATRNPSAKLRDIRPGTFRTAHLPYRTDVADTLKAEGIHHLLMLRNPQNVIVSQIRYVTQQHRGNVFSKYFNENQTKSEQIALVIEGNEHFPGLGERLNGYRKWLELDSVMPLRFEEVLEGMRSGDPAAFVPLVNFIGLNIDETTLASALNNAKEHPGLTFSGKVSSVWAEHYDEKARALYEKLVLPEAAALGYPNLPWE